MLSSALFALLALGAPGAQGSTDGVALRGLDPVALCHGSESPAREDLRATHGRYTYGFASEETRAAFQAEPERWCIQWGGGCGRMGPLSGVGNADRWTVHAGRIYIFASDGCRDGFLKAPEQFVAAPSLRPEPTPEMAEAGRAWIERAVGAHGGAQAIDRDRTLHLISVRETSGWKQRLEQDISRDGAIERRSRWTPPEPDEEPYETVWATAPSEGSQSYIDEGEDRIPMTSPDQIDDLTRFALREPISLLWLRAKNDFAAYHLGQAQLGSMSVENVLVQVAGLATTLHLDPESARVVGLSWRGRLNDGRTREIVETFTRWKDIDGVSIPVARTIEVDSELQPSLATVWQSVELSE